MQRCAVVKILIFMGMMVVSCVQCRVLGDNGAKMQVLTVKQDDGRNEIRAFSPRVMAKDTLVEGHPGHLRELCDGSQLLRMLYTDADDLLDCTLDTDPSKVKAFWYESLGLYENGKDHDFGEEHALNEVADRVMAKSDDIKVELVDVHVEEEKVHFEKMLDLLAHKLMCQHHHSAGHHNSSSHSRSPRSLSLSGIFPGTNWCGDGNAAQSQDDLGEALEVDRCCRAHDECPYWIDSFSQRYNHFNFGLYTIVHCICDEQFKTCLRLAEGSGDPSASRIGNIYFNIMEKSCFILQPARVCVDRAWYGVCRRWGPGEGYQAQIRPNTPY